jgi:hypothetical protein
MKSGRGRSRKNFVMASISRDVHFQTRLTIKSTQQISKYISLLEERDKLNFSIVISIADESVGIPEFAS